MLACPSMCATLWIGQPASKKARAGFVPQVMERQVRRSESLP